MIGRHWETVLLAGYVFDFLSNRMIISDKQCILTRSNNWELTHVWPSHPPKRTDPSIGLNMPPERGSAHSTTATTRPDMVSDAAIGELLTKVGFSAISGMPRPSARLGRNSIEKYLAEILA